MAPRGGFRDEGMKMNDFAKSAAARDAFREPIRDTIREHWPDISAALARGASNKSIATQLKAQFRAPVGSTSGFNSALNFVMAEKGYVRLKRSTVADGSAPSGSPIVVASPLPNFSDTRRKSSF
jgi:hypothetical protein